MKVLTMKTEPERMTLYEFVHVPPQDAQVDRNQGVIRNVKILGLFSRNKRRYPESTLLDAVSLYENAKVNLNHPEGEPTRPRNYRDRLGLVRDVRLVEGDGLFADFHFNPKHPLAEQLLWDAEHAPENVGFSHNIEAEVVQEDETMLIRKILAVRSVDLVADPATTAGLFESVQPTKNSKREEILEQFAKKLIEFITRKHSESEQLFTDRFFRTITETTDPGFLQNHLAERITLLESLAENRDDREDVVRSREQQAEPVPGDTRVFAKQIYR